MTDNVEMTVDAEAAEARDDFLPDGSTPAEEEAAATSTDTSSNQSAADQGNTDSPVGDILDDQESSVITDPVTGCQTNW